MLFTAILVGGNLSAISDHALWAACIGAIVTIASLVVKYFNDLAMQQRKDKLERINLQLKHLYSPLYASLHAGETAYLGFRKRHRHGKPYFDDSTTDEDREAWRLWMTEVFMPINLQMESAIVWSAELIIEDEMPECFLLLCAHVAAYKPVLKQWKDGDYSRHLSIIEFPRKQMNEYVYSRFLKLKGEQNRLLGKLRIKAIPTPRSAR